MSNLITLKTFSGFRTSSPKSRGRQLFVVYWNNIPAPYMVERFNALADRATFRFEAWFNSRLEDDRSWLVDESQWRFNYRYVPRIRFLRWELRCPPVLLGLRPDVLVSLYAEPCFVVGWLIARLRGIHTAFWCQVTFDAWVRRARWKNAIKGFMFRRVGATLGSGEQSREFAMRFGTSSQRALVLRHSIDVKHYVEESKKALRHRMATRSRLGLSGITFVYVGRLWKGKGLTVLLDAFHIMQQTFEDPTSLLVVGDGPEENSLRKKCEELGLRNVVFVGFKHKQEIPAYYAASDVFVFPTLGDPYGLVVNEAMACGLPVISSDAAGEIRERIEHGISGYIVPAGDPESLANKMTEFASDDTLRQEMGRSAREVVIGRDPEAWARRFETIVEALADNKLPQPSDQSDS